MNRNRTLLPALAVLGTLLTWCAGCMQSDLPGEGGDGTTVPVPLHIISIGLPITAHDDTGVPTRAAHVTELTSGIIGVFRTQAEGYSDKQENIPYEYAGGWKPHSDNNQIFLMTKAAGVCAYYPYNNSYTNPEALPLSFGRYTGTADNLTAHDPGDICYAAEQQKKGESPYISFGMGHAMALLKLTFSRVADETSVCRIREIGLSNPALIENATLNIRTGACTSADATPPGTLTWKPAGSEQPVAVPGNGNPATITFRMPPCTLTGDLQFTFKETDCTLYAEVKNSLLPAFEAAKMYEIKFAIVAGKLISGGVTTQWNEAWSNDTQPVLTARP